MQISSDQTVLWQYGFAKIDATMVYTWVLMLVLVLGSFLVTRRLSLGLKQPKWQSVLEIVVTSILAQIEGVGLANPKKYIPFIGTLLIFIAVSNLFTILPGWLPPTGSLSTTTALALSVFVAVPLFGIEDQGIGGYLKTYLQPTPVMLPFNILTELSRTLALAVRLFGNAMSAVMIISILLTITPFIFPIVMTLLGLLTGMVQAYIFGILATVYIAAAVRSHTGNPQPAAAT